MGDVSRRLVTLDYPLTMRQGPAEGRGIRHHYTGSGSSGSSNQQHQQLRQKSAEEEQVDRALRRILQEPPVL
jgi:hypothetical protein